MFEMIVTEAIRVHNSLIAIAGSCINKRNYTQKLKDDSGNIYETHIPFGKTLVFDDSVIALGLIGDYIPEIFIGKKLKNA